MDWNSPFGILRRAMQIERDGYRFYMDVARMATGERAKEMFRSLANDEVTHLRILLIEYRALEEGKGWVAPTDADLELIEIPDPANPELPGEEYPEESPIFSPAREPSIENDIAALEFGMETERLSYELYKNAAREAQDPRAHAVYEQLAQEENRHYEILQHSHEYLSENQTWWDTEEFPFFEG